MHLTQKPRPSRLTPWPVSFRHPILAIAPQPGAPVGALSSEALAVGEGGAVARYKPGEGWLPESLFGPGGRVETNVRLRSVSWPTPSRAYAVGDEGEMWLWRGETGLWENDPATPINFRGNLLGVAFDPANPTRGYAVGTTPSVRVACCCATARPGPKKPNSPRRSRARLQRDRLLRLGGDRRLQQAAEPARDEFVGGLLVNEGSGLADRPGSGAAAGGAVPRAVAGLPDGGAAFVASVPGRRSTSLRARIGRASPWQSRAHPAAGSPRRLARAVPRRRSPARDRRGGGVGLSGSTAADPRGSRRSCTPERRTLRGGKRRRAAPDGRRLER